MFLRQIYKMIAGSLLISSILTSPLARGAGTNSGGGGVNYRVNGQLKTLTDVGVIFEKVDSLRSKKYPVYYEVRPETKAALEKIVSLLPTNFPSTEKILGNEGDLIDEKEIDPKEYAQIKNDYAQVIKSYGKKLDPSAFVLVAFSKNRKTYILPTFDEQGLRETTAQMAQRQALTLIHEYWMRMNLNGENSRETLAKVLNLDVAIALVLKSDLKDDLNLRFQDALHSLGGISQSELRNLKFKTLEKLLGRPVFRSELIRNGTFECDPSKIQKFEKVVPGIAETFERLNLYTKREAKVFSYTGLSGRIILEEIDMIRDSWRREKVQQELFTSRISMNKLCAQLNRETQPNEALITIAAENRYYQFSCSAKQSVDGQIIFESSSETILFEE